MVGVKVSYFEGWLFLWGKLSFFFFVFIIIYFGYVLDVLDMFDLFVKG